MIDGRWNQVSATRGGPPEEPARDSLEMFLHDRPWGYARQTDGSTIEYHVEHPTWSVFPAKAARFEVDVAKVYSREYIEALEGDPVSIFIAAGSSAVLHPGKLIT